MPREFKERREGRGGRDGKKGGRDRDGRDRDGRDKGDKRDRFFKKRYCRYCKDPNLKIDYKDGKVLSAFVSERGKILPRRITANCAYHQREVVTAIKRARILALLPFSATQVG